jgi:hypothetical protein
LSQIALASVNFALYFGRTTPVLSVVTPLNSSETNSSSIFFGSFFSRDAAVLKGDDVRELGYKDYQVAVLEIHHSFCFQSRHLQLVRHI